MNRNIKTRREYRNTRFDEKHAEKNPFKQFDKWFNAAKRKEPGPAEAAALATTDASSKANARIILVKSISAKGFTFFTDYRSPKAKELGLHPSASLVFYWPLSERQVRIKGTVSKISERESARYFSQRPAGAQAAAWSSHQSKPVKNRASLEAKKAAFLSKAEKEPLLLPPHWGGLRLLPKVFEFWQGRPDRLNDRLEYRKLSGKWQLRRLQP